MNESSAAPDVVPHDARPAVVVRRLGLRPYPSTRTAMIEFTSARTESTPDEIWLLEHEPVYTLGQAGRISGVNPADIATLLIHLKRSRPHASATEVGMF